MAVKSFTRTVEAINVLLDKLDGLPTYPMAYKGSINNPSYLPEEATEGDLYLVYYADTSNVQVINSLYYRKHNGQWSVIANISYTQAQIDEMFAAIGGGLHWKGAVSYYSNLPSDAELGDMWTVLYEGTTGTDPCGDEYAWGTLSGTDQWILIGKETYSKTQIDDMVDGLTDRIAINETNIFSLNTLIATYRFSNATPATITLPSQTSRTLILIGYLQGIGNVNYTLEIDGSGILTVKNSYNGTTVSNTGITFDTDTKILTLTGLTAGYSTATLIATTQ